MIRNTWSDNRKYAYLNSLDSRRVFDIRRDEDNGNTDYAPVTQFASQMWLKLIKADNIVSSFYSANGVN